MSKFTPELGQAAFSNSPQGETSMPRWLGAALAGLGAAAAENSSTGEDPTSNSGASFVSDVFALRAYCWCDGEGEHVDGCPPNFEHFASGLTAHWYKHVGRSGSLAEAPVRRRWLAALEDCWRSLADSSVGAQRAALAARCEAVLAGPEGGARVAVSLEGDEAHLAVTLPWPAALSADPEQPPVDELGAAVAATGERLRTALLPDWHLDWPTDYTCAAPFPPLFGDADPVAAAAYRRLTDEELAADGHPAPADALEDERLVLIAYTGINVFAAAQRA